VKDALTLGFGDQEFFTQITSEEYSNKLYRGGVQTEVAETESAQDDDVQSVTSDATEDKAEPVAVATPRSKKYKDL